MSSWKNFGIFLVGQNLLGRALRLGNVPIQRSSLAAGHNKTLIRITPFSEDLWPFCLPTEHCSLSSSLLTCGAFPSIAANGIRVQNGGPRPPHPPPEKGGEVKTSPPTSQRCKTSMATAFLACVCTSVSVHRAQRAYTLEQSVPLQFPLYFAARYDSSRIYFSYSTVTAY